MLPILFLLAFAVGVWTSPVGAAVPVTGTVVDESGVAVANATVQIVETGAYAGTDAQGAFRIADIDPGRYHLKVIRLGYLEKVVELTVGAEAPAALRLAIVAKPLDMKGITIIGSVEELSRTRAEHRQVPGSVALIEPEELRSTRQANFEDVFRFTPGVWAAPRFGAADESQLSIRGSGLRNNFHLRGVNLLVNGMPYRNADGFSDFESLELLTTNAIEVYKGGNALRYGGSTLGGAVNLQTMTGHNAAAIQAFGEGGSYGFVKGQVSSGNEFGDGDYYASYARTQIDGYREYSGQERDRVNGHVGWQLSDAVNARAFYFYADVEEDLPGSLTQEEFDEDPTQAAPNNVQNQWGRDYRLHHVGVQFRSSLSEGRRLEIAPYFQYRDIVHPIFQVIDQVSRDFGIEGRYEENSTVAGRKNRLTIGAQHAFGNVDSHNYTNNGGESGDLQKDQDDEAGSTGVYLEDAFHVSQRTLGVIGLRYDYNRRATTDHFLSNGDQSDDRNYEAFLPKLGIIHDFTERNQLYANASRSYEPPLLLELNSLTVPGFIDLEPQDAWQFEIGTRGQTGRLGWDVSAYDIELRNEITNVNVRPFPNAPFTVPTYRNIDESRHAGFEAGLDWVAVPDADDASPDDPLRLRFAYTFGRNRFVNDPTYGSNQIPGVPEHVVRAEARWRHKTGLVIAPSVDWVPQEYAVNSDNSVMNDGWVTLSLRGEFLVRKAGLNAFAELRNLTDEHYAAAVTVDDAAGRFFQPADGRAIYAGLNLAR
jgi:iron complex outermembrane receptor protein